MRRNGSFLTSDRTFPIVVLAAMAFVVSTILYEAFITTINLSITGDPFHWKTTCECPSCGGMGFCVDPQTSLYRCERCGWEDVVRE